jgi:NAD(P)-dependent dehydrogenase (short-subunit alcohol dehydrogenase family)
MGYGEQTTTTEVLSGVDLSGKVAMVTGASTGLGLETARALAAAGAHVILAVRTDDKGETSRTKILETVPAASLEHVLLDLGSLESVRTCASTILARHDRIDLLINNAGVMFTPFDHTTDGFELQFGTNHIGHFLLTNLLVPAVLAAAPARIVNLSSAAHQSSDVDLDDPNFERRPYDKFVSYGRSKTANVLFSVELERRLAAKGVHSYAVHPGMIATELSRHMTKDDMYALRDRAKRGPSGGLPGLKSLEAGAATTVWAATAPELASTGGVYLVDCQIAEPAAWALDTVSAARLWALSEDLVGQHFDW